MIRVGPDFMLNNASFNLTMATQPLTREQMLQVCGQTQGWVRPEECVWLFEAASQIRPGGSWVDVGYGPGRTFLAAGLGLPGDGRLIGVHHVPGGLQPTQAGGTLTEECEKNVRRLCELRPDLSVSIADGDSVDALQHIADGSIDVVFVNASRNPAWIAARLTTWLPRITAHGCLSGLGMGRPEWMGVTRAVLESLPGVSSGAGSIWTWTPAPPYSATAESPRLSVIVATTGRASLPATLASIRTQQLLEGDEVLLVHDGQVGIETVGAWEQAKLPGQMIILPTGPHGDWGAAARTAGQNQARGSYLLWQDDDDVYLPGAFDVIRREIVQSPEAILLFRLAYPDGKLLWRAPVILCRNVSTQMYVVPRTAQLGQWGSHYQGDFAFIETTIAANPGRQVRFVDKPTVMYSR